MAGRCFNTQNSTLNNQPLNNQPQHPKSREALKIQASKLRHWSLVMEFPEGWVLVIEIFLSVVCWALKFY